MYVRSECCPGGSRHLQSLDGEGLPNLGQWGQLVGAQLAQAPEVRDALVLAHRHERDPRLVHVKLAERVEHLHDLHLVVEVRRPKRGGRSGWLSTPGPGCDD
jgi:hypothetical protein